MDPEDSEIIVPYDAWCDDVATLAAAFPRVTFHPIDEAGAGAVPPESLGRHQLYESRRAAGLARARGAIVALTEDYAVPAPDWVRQMRAAHTPGRPVVGGAVENGVDRPLNWALYYCDFGRFGRPFSSGRAQYLSDVNVSYARDLLTETAPVWRSAYQETTMHWALQAGGHQLWLDPSPVVFQHRPALPLGEALRERAALGRAFAATRADATRGGKRLMYAVATPFLPPLLLYRCIRHMIRQQRTAAQILTTLPYLLAFLSAYALGELSGYAAPRSVAISR
jgi:hypothetical protein